MGSAFNGAQGNIGGIYETAHFCCGDQPTGFYDARIGARRWLPQKLATGSVLPHGQQHRHRPLPLRLLISLSLTVALSASASSSGEAFETIAVVSGMATARDGDDLLFGRVPVRLQGIAAPEDSARQRDEGGPEATEHLRKMVDGRFVVCHLDGSTAGTNRSAGVCYLGLVEINHRQVEAGLARDCPAYSHGRYAAAELAARDAGNDLSASYDLPDYCEPAR
ncbi:MAG: thermonuclease family protein [Neoaquamicrobium sediminum]